MKKGMYCNLLQFYIKDSEFIKNALVLNTPMPISLKEAYYEYHYGIFSDAYLKKQQNS